jgi:hypothetical protein
MKNDHAREYARRGLKGVEGWLTPTAASCIADLAEVQQRQGIRGGACEIGVHHGRLFILLHKLLREDERSLAVDLFEQQSDNIDGSGCGDRARFMRNLKIHGIDPGRVEVLAENSLQLTSDRVRQSIGAPRIFSIDGGHTAAITFSDLAVASSSVCDDGLVILDDFLDPGWLGVTEGAFRFMLERGGLDPIAFVSNKMFFSRGNASAYKAAISGERSELFGTDVVIGNSKGLRQRLVDTPLWRGIRGTAVGRFVRRVSQLTQ